MSSLLDEVLAANRAHQQGEPVPRPPSLGPRNLVVLCCSDPRLTSLLPAAMGVAPDEMFQIRNPGNDALGRNMLRSVVAALVLDMGNEVFVVGHTDCAMCKATAVNLLDGMKRLGIPREALAGEDIRGWFGAIASERSHAMGAAKTLRESAVFPLEVPVHALLVDTASGRLELLEDGRRKSGKAPMKAPGFRPAPAPPRPTPLPSSRPAPPPAEPDPSPVLAPIPEIEPEPELMPVPESEPKRPPPPKPRPKPPPVPPRGARTVRKERRSGDPEESPFERAEEVLKRLMERRKR